MLHNSLHRRDLLLAMNREPLVLARRDVHRNVAVRAGAKAAADQFILEGGWSITTAGDSVAERLVAADAADFLKRLDVAIAADASNRILFEIGSCDAGFRLVAEPQRVEVHAADAASLWAGWIHLENQMRAARGPIVRRGEMARQPAWDVQIAPPSWGANYAVPDLSSEFLDDDTFRALAHQGADGMLVYGDWLLYAGGSGIPELDHPDASKHIATLRDATDRAAGYGVKLYYCPVSPKLRPDHIAFAAHPSIRGARLQSGAIHCLCSSNADALQFHAHVLGNLFREVPRLGGLILIIGGESYYHCFMRSANTPVGQTNCPQCAGRLAEHVIAKLLDVTAAAVHAHQPGAHVMAWPYSAQAFWSREPHQLQLIDRLPWGVALLSEIDKDQVIQKTAPTGAVYTKAIWDYSVDYDGHSDRIIAQGQRCRQRDRGLFIKTETAHGIELLHLPYVPSITRSARRWQSVRALRPRGVLQRWGFVGMFDSVAERIGFQARWDPDFTPAGACAAVATQLFGSAAGAVVSAWQAFDEAVGHIPMLTTGGYYIGPMFLGPAHPLPTWTGETPQAFRGSLFYLTETDATFTPPRPRGGDDLTLTNTAPLGGHPPLDVVEAEFAAARDASAKGHQILQKIAPEPHSPQTRQEIIEQQAIGEYLYRTFRTTVNVIRYLRAREAGGKATAALPAIVKDELENTDAARDVYTRAPWLNHALRLDVGVPDSIAMIDEKLRLLRAFTP